MQGFTANYKGILTVCLSLWEGGGWDYTTSGLHNTSLGVRSVECTQMQMIDVAHLSRGFVRGCPRSGWSTAVAPGRPTAARETEDTAPIQRTSPSPQAKTIPLVSLYKILSRSGTRLGGSRSDRYINNSPTHSCTIYGEGA